jgi:hypothetical protein
MTSRPGRKTYLSDTSVSMALHEGRRFLLKVRVLTALQQLHTLLQKQNNNNNNNNNKFKANLCYNRTFGIQSDCLLKRDVCYNKTE